MAAVASTLTFTAGQWKYVDVTGVEHTVTTSQTLSLSIDDNSATDVQYSFKSGQSVTTTDGLKIAVCARASQGQVGSNSNVNRTIGTFTDAGQGAAFVGLSGEFAITCPVTGIRQIWRTAQVTPSDADFGSAGTITMVLEDQFGHRMSIPFQLISTIAVGQAA